MSELAMTVLRLSYLVLLWIFVWAAISVLRQDLYSVTRVTPRGRGRAQEPARRGRKARKEARQQARQLERARQAEARGRGPYPHAAHQAAHEAAQHAPAQQLPARQVHGRAGAPGSASPQPIGPTDGAPNLPPRMPERAAGRPPSRLRITAGKLAGTSVPLGRSAIVVGRAQSCSLVLDDDYASSRHARLFPTGDAWFVEDLGSTNGTFVNGQRISEPTQLALGQVIQIGQSTMELTR